MPKNKKYEAWLLERLKDHDEAVAYLNEALEQSLNGDKESERLFLIALKRVADARGGITQLAQKAHLGRESLYKTLSGKGNPRWSSLLPIMQAMDLKIKFA